MADKAIHTETDAACMGIAIVICDALIVANLLTVEDLTARLAAFQTTLTHNQYATAAGILGTVLAAISDPDARAKRDQFGAELLALAKTKGPTSS